MIEFHSGEVSMVDYTPAVAVAAGEGRVVGGLLRITHRAIAAGELGAEAVPAGTAKYKVPLEAGASYAVGVDVPFHEANQKAGGVGATANVGLRAAQAADQGAGDVYVICVHGA